MRRRLKRFGFPEGFLRGKIQILLAGSERTVGSEISWLVKDETEGLLPIAQCLLKCRMNCV